MIIVKKLRWSISRVLSRTIIHLGQASLLASSNLPKNDTGRTCLPKQTALLFGLAPGGVYLATPVTSRAVRSYRTISTLPNYSKIVRRCIFCCTCRRLAPPRSYLAPCPLEPGLSSQLVKLKARLSDHLSGGSYLTTSLCAEVSVPCRKRCFY
jgi:hypothetical protein